MSPDPLAFDLATLTRRLDAGDGAAAHRLAVMAAMGLGRPQDWTAALDLLDRASALGFAPATAQIALLAGPSGRIDPDLWLTAPRPRPISDSPAILAVDGFLPESVCDWLRNQAADRVEPALVYDPVTGEGRRDTVRTNAATQIGPEQTDLVLALVRERIARTAGLPVPGLEWTQVLHYAVGQTFDWHVDWLDPSVPGHRDDLTARGQRIATLLVFLNDDFEGGETAFEAGGLRHRGRKGDALLWANTRPDGAIDRRTRHAGLPPTRGEKWVLSQWLRGWAPRG
ncbi:MAG: 2OG-Fe(II) oxygenase [Brevundimonas sp.]